MQPINELHQHINEAVAHIKKQISFEPEIGVILGTGLGSLVDGIEMVGTVDYDTIPHFPVSTVESHAGRLLFGKLGGKSVVCMQGRFHFYEGYTFQQIAFPIRVLKALGVQSLVVSNAAGGMNPNFKPGDIMLIKDHINFFPGNPLIGPNDEKIGPRFPDMYDLYYCGFQQIAKEVALEQGLPLQVGGLCWPDRSLSGNGGGVSDVSRVRRRRGGDVNRP